MENELQSVLKRIRLEFHGIKSTIEDYTLDGNVINYLNKLEIAIIANDLFSIKYCLNALSVWYNNNMNKIESNNYVHNKSSHIENKKKIENFLNVLNRHEDSEVEIVNPSTQTTSNEPLIFLSHKSDDTKYADALEKFIIGLGVKNSQLIYTSHPLHKVPMDKNIYDYLRERINNNVFIIFLFSNEYLKSPACMNEMGAAWVVQSDYTNIYTPDFSFGNPLYHQCAIDTHKMGAVLNGDEHCKASMIELKDKIQKLFNLDNDEKNSQYLIDQFIKEITE